jgi:hypothetical protein
MIGKTKPGAVPANRVGVFDGKGNLRGHVARTATQIGVARILGNFNSELRTVGGRKEWHQC